MSFLWIFQFLFFNSFYKEQKINDIKSVATKINKYQNKKIVATHMHNSARKVAINNPIKNLIIPNDNEEIIL